MGGFLSLEEITHAV